MIRISLLWVFVTFQLVFVWGSKKGLEPPLPKHHKGPVYGPTDLKYCKANTTCPADYVPYDAVYLTAYILTKNNDPYTGYYLFVSKHLNEYGQFTLTSKQSEALIASINIPAKQADGFANAGSIKTWNADYHHYPHLGAVLGYGSNSSYLVYPGYNYYALSPTTVTGKYSKPVSGGYSAYAYFTDINAPKEESLWSIVYHTFGAPGHIYPVWYNPVYGQETSNALWWFPGESEGGNGFAHGAIFGMPAYDMFETRFSKKIFKDFFPLDMTPHPIHGFVPGKPNHPPP